MQTSADTRMPPPPPPAYSLPPRAGFPLWGKLLLGCFLLAVLAIIVLGAIAGRFLVGARSAFQTASCVQSLRTAQRGLNLYSEDYDQTLPKATVWMDAATPYVKARKNHTEFVCPTAHIKNPQAYGYAFNNALSGSVTSKIATPEKTALLYDSSDLQRNASDALATLPTPPRHVRLATRASQGPKNGNLIIYADGHVNFVGQDGASIEMTRNSLRKDLFSQPQKKAKEGSK